MAVTPLPLLNPGAEDGVLAPWVHRSGDGHSVTSGTAHSGTYKFRVDNGFAEHAKFDQEVAFDAGQLAVIATGVAGIHFSGWFDCDGVESAKIYIEVYNGAALIATYETVIETVSVYTQKHKYAILPAAATKVRVGGYNTSPGFAANTRYDDFALEFSDDAENDWPVELAPKAYQAPMLAIAAQNATLGDAPVQVQTQQVAMLALASEPAEQVRAHTTSQMVIGAAETLSGEHDVKVHQIVMLALVKGRPDTRRLRAWTFPQDDHDFYVLHLGRDKTIIFDTLTRQWCSWKSPGKAIWRGSDGLAWETINVAGDVTAGLIWNIDPSVRDDDDIDGLAEDRTPIRTVVRGMYATRLRNALGCYRATLTVAQGSPAAAGVGMQLRTSVDEAKSWVDHGFLQMDQVGQEYDVSWVSLGLITAPGMIFEIIDTGYTNRINALDIDLGDDVEGRGGNN